MILTLIKTTRYYILNTGRYIKRGLRHCKAAISHRSTGDPTTRDLTPAGRATTSGMSNTDFLELCYQGILGRAPSETDKVSFVSQLEAGTKTRDEFVCEILQCPEFASQSASREAYPAGHFFSALPSAQEREQYVRDISCESVAGIDLRLAA
jgi:citrate synthase